MKKFLFVGGTNGNTGPANVNKGIVANLSDAFCIADSVNKVKKYIDAYSQPQKSLTFPKPPLPRTCHIKKVCTSQVQ